MPATKQMILERRPLLTERQAAEYLGLKPQTLSLWRMTGKNLPYIKVGGLVRYRPEELEKFLESKTVGVKAGA